MRPLPLPARLLARIADVVGPATSSSGIASRHTGATFAASAVVTVVVLFGLPFGSLGGRIVIACVAMACWTVLLAVVGRDRLEAGRGGPALHLVGFWLSGSGVVGVLFDPRASGAAFAVLFGAMALFAWLCYGKYVLLFGGEEDESPDVRIR